ncbi:acyltransferase domain-containing protein [Streptomyces sp. NPDC001852]|uniref:acyltransferase domain-containing protein n=1 Tax=Streptomyces sp. NPDC001852 TaxID=3364619 RepID=UPI0036A90B53
MVDADGDTAVLFASGPEVRPAVARTLYGACAEFRAEFDAMCRVADRRLPLPLAAVVFAPQDGVDARLLHRAEFRRTALFAYQVALFRLWREWDVPRVAAVAGEGAGACAAAYAAGVLGLDEAVRLLVSGRRLHEHGGSRAERALRAGGFGRVLRCAPDHENLDGMLMPGGVRRLRPELLAG